MKTNRKFALMFLVVVFILSFAFEVSARGGGGGGRGGHGRGGGWGGSPILGSSGSEDKIRSYALLKMKENPPYVVFASGRSAYDISFYSSSKKLYFEDKGDYWLLNGNIPKGTFLKVPLGYKVRCNALHTESGNEFSKKKAGNGRIIYSGETTVKYIQSSGLEVLKK